MLEIGINEIQGDGLSADSLPIFTRKILRTDPIWGILGCQWKWSVHDRDRKLVYFTYLRDVSNLLI